MAKPQLHVSALRMLYRCGVQFEFRYVKNVRKAPGFAAVMGIAAHEVIRADLKNKITTGELLPDEQISDLARDKCVETIERGVSLNDRDPKPAKMAGMAIDGAIQFAQTHHAEAAPFIDPKEVEQPWVVELGGFPFDLAGTMDIREKSETIRDTKSSGRSPQSSWAHTSEQLTLYSLAHKYVNGVAPGAVALDYLVRHKDGTVDYKKYPSKRTEVDIEMEFRRIEQAARVIESGTFAPADPDSWGCSERWCGYWDMCPFAKRPVSV